MTARRIVLMHLDLETISNQLATLTHSFSSLHSLILASFEPRCQPKPRPDPVNPRRKLARLRRKARNALLRAQFAEKAITSPLRPVLPPIGENGPHALDLLAETCFLTSLGEATTVSDTTLSWMPEVPPSSVIDARTDLASLPTENTWETFSLPPLSPIPFIPSPSSTNLFSLGFSLKEPSGSSGVCMEELLSSSLWPLTQ